MQIIIPMSGFGERFRLAGYQVPKPLIELEGRAMVAHVVDMFPGESDITFICNQTHLDTPGYRMRAILQESCPTARIVGIPAHRKGPIHAVQQIQQQLDPNRPTVVNYCDFTCYWNWTHFKHFVQQTACAGAIAAYRGFHPHSLGSTQYAYLRVLQNMVHDIQEKHPFTDNRMQEYTSSGTYYFATAALMLDAFAQTVQQQLHVGDEYYVSLGYKPLLEQKKSVCVYPLQHFMQWGTPEDVTEYQFWSKTFRQLVDPRRRHVQTPQGTLLVPMAGLGERFRRQGYTTSKPMLNVSGQAMAIQAARHLPKSSMQGFVLRAQMPERRTVLKTLQENFPQAVIDIVEKPTQGQACTAQRGLQAIKRQKSVYETPLTIGTCDSGVLYQQNAFRRACADPDTDILVWGTRGYPNAVRFPRMYSWVKLAKNNNIEAISTKKPLAHPEHDPIVLVIFTFCCAGDFERAYQRLIHENDRVNQEFYIDTLINHARALGMRCKLFEVDSFLCWGTPNDLKTFEYWQSCFHKWKQHPYRIENDPDVPKAACKDLEARFSTMAPDASHAPNTAIGQIVRELCDN